MKSLQPCKVYDRATKNSQNLKIQAGSQAAPAFGSIDLLDQGKSSLESCRGEARGNVR